MAKEAIVKWGGHPVKLVWQPEKIVQTKDIITSVHCCCFYEGRLLLVKVKNRGFNLPGGHIEANETPEEAIHREVFEEGFVKGKLSKTETDDRNRWETDNLAYYEVIFC